MRNRKIDNDKFLIMYNKKYFIVNDFAKKLFEELEKTSDAKLIAKDLNMPTFKVKKYYKKLQKEIVECDFYDDNIELDYPLKLQWRITQRCNLKCKHCYLGDLSNKQLTKKEMLDITNKLVESNVMEITLTGGECLIVKELPEIVYRFITNEIYVTIFTNGILLKNFINQLEQLGKFDKKYLSFNISIDGLEKEHDEIRGKNTYKKTIEAIKYLKKKNYYVLTNTVLNKINYKGIPKLYSILYKLNVDKIQLSNLIDSGRATSKMKLDLNDRKELISDLKKVVSKYDNGTKLLYAELPDEDNKSKIYLADDKNDSFLQKEDWKCSAGIGKATLDYDGKVYCCPFLKESLIGDIVQEDLKKIWNKKERLLFIKKLIKDNNNSRLCIAAKRRLK